MGGRLVAGDVRVLTTGTIMVDVLAVGLPHVAAPGEVVYTPNQIETRIGGHPIDVAIDLIELGADPSEVAVAAAVGRGPYADFARRVMDEHRVTAYLQDVPDLDTGKNVVLAVIGEDRRFHIDAGANWRLDPEHVVATIERLGPEVFCIRPGYSGIDLHLEQVMSATGDALVFLDVMVPHPDRPRDFLDAVFPVADLVHGNEQELTAVTRTTDVDAAIDRLIDDGVQLVLVTNGPHGARAVGAEFDITQSAFAVDVVDATGCGDAFCAGVVRELMVRFPLLSTDSPALLDAKAVAEILAAAQAAGAACATEAGCVDGVTRDRVDGFLNEQGRRVLTSTTPSNRSREEQR